MELNFQIIEENDVWLKMWVKTKKEYFCFANEIYCLFTWNAVPTAQTIFLYSTISTVSALKAGTVQWFSLNCHRRDLFGSNILHLGFKAVSDNVISAIEHPKKAKIYISTVREQKGLGTTDIRQDGYHNDYLTIIPQARMGYESIAHEAEGLMGYWLRGHEGERNNCFSKIQLVGQKNIKTNIFSQVLLPKHYKYGGAFR